MMHLLAHTFLLAALGVRIDPCPSEAIVLARSMRSWTYLTSNRAQVLLRTDGGPVDAEVELWHGTCETPFKVRAYAADGLLRPLDLAVETPNGPNTVVVRNLAQDGVPIVAGVWGDHTLEPSAWCRIGSQEVSGRGVGTYPLPASGSVEVFLQTESGPLNARLELSLEGENRQVVQIYTENGCTSPFHCFLCAPEGGSLRVLNTTPAVMTSAVAVEAHDSKRPTSAEE